MGSRKAGFYRHDLDGLRGVAILLVAAFHIWFGRVSGGVDVFLVLSGFFFGGKLLRNALSDQPALSPRRELVRLVRRLLPALVVVLAASAVLTILIQPQTRWEAFADQSLASLGYYQNWELAWTASNYLKAGEAVSPLQHIWSMSVQGQFYLAFLLVVFGVTALLRRPLGKRLRIFFVVLLSALTIASFVYAIFAHQADQSTAYYNSFARAWELLAGALAGALVGYVRWPMWLRTVAATIGLAAILSCGWLIDGVKRVSRAVGAGAGRCHGADDPGGGQPAGRSPHPRQDAAAQPGAGAGPAGDARLDGLLAVSVALAAADLLAGVDRPQPCQFRGGRRNSAGVGRPGVPDDAVRRGTAALPGPGGAQPRPRPR